MDPLPLTVIALAMAMLFATAAFGKWRDQAGFRAILAGYRLLPQWSLGPAVTMIPLAEAAVALLWLLPPARIAASAASAALLLLYASALAVNLLRGRTDMSCGCRFGGTDRISWWLVARNLLLCGAAVTAGLPAGARALGPADYGVAVMAALAAVLLYLCMHQLAGNAAVAARAAALRRS